MRTLSTTLKALSCALFITALSAAAQAQPLATHTWVSAAGDDASTCSRVAPCKTLAGALSKTAVSGEINALDAGPFPYVVITKSVTIDGASVFPRIVNPGGMNGVTVNDSASGSPNTAVVTLRNLSINGTSADLPRSGLTGGPNFGPGLSGILFAAGKTVNVENCKIFGNTTGSPSGAGIRVGLTVSGSNLNVKNTSIYGNRVGITATASTGHFTLNLNGCHIEHNTTDGILLSARAFATIRNSNLAFNGGAAVSLSNAAANSATVDDSEINHNNIGLLVGTGTTVRLGRSLITQNATNFSNSGTIVTSCNNETDTNPLPGTVTQSCAR